MKKEIKMIALFDYNSITGFSTVSKNLVNNWKKIFGSSLKLDIVAVNYFEENYSVDENIRVISAKRNDVAKDDFGRYVFMKSLMDGNYDISFILQDLGVVTPMVPHVKKILDDKKKENKKLFKSILYFPIDFALTPNLVKGLEFFDQLATFTEYGRSMFNILRPDLKTKIKVIPHGGNTKDFYPILENEEEAKLKKFKKEYFGEANVSKFIVGCVNRNQSRKDIPTTIFGFMEYWEKNPKSFLYLHCDPNDPMGWNLRTIMSQTPLQEGIDYMFMPIEEGHVGVSVEKLNMIYNSLDVFLTTATGGGWELTVTEAMACRVPTIIPRHTSFLTLGGANGERSYFIETLYPIVAMVDNIIRFQSDLYEISDTLELIYNQKQEDSIDLENRLDKALEFIRGLDWRDIAKTFSEDIKRLS
jgi:glycosyltransferase involved in cell wall biosynthesis